MYIVDETVFVYARVGLPSGKERDEPRVEGVVKTYRRTENRTRTIIYTTLYIAMSFAR